MTDSERTAIVRRAKEIWTEREAGFPAFVRQTWQAGSSLAKDATLMQAANELDVSLRFRWVREID